MWTSRNMSSYLGLVAQWCPDHADTIVKLTLDFVWYVSDNHFHRNPENIGNRVPKRHTGLYFSNEVYTVLRNFVIDTKVHIFLFHVLVTTTNYPCTATWACR